MFYLNKDKTRYCN